MVASKEIELGAELKSIQPLKRRVFRAGSWTLVGHFATLVLRLASSIILTRIFSPEVFGLLAILLALNTLLAVLTDIGLRQAVVQSPSAANARFLHTAFAIQVLRGIFVWGLCILVAGVLLIARRAELLPSDSVYAQPLLPELLIVTSLSSVILGFTSMRTYTATRDLRLGRLTVIDLLSFVAGQIFIVGLGLLTRSIWSYIAGLILTATLTVLLGHIWLRGPKDGFAWDKAALRELSHFGRWIFFSSAVSATILNGDRMFLSALLSPAELGLYSIANNLVSVPDALASKLFSSVAMPTLSEVNRSQPGRFASLLSRMRWLSDSLLMFIAGFLFASGEAIVRLIYDPRYAEAGWMLQLLALGLVFARYNIAGSAYMALGRPQYLTAVAIIRSISLFSFLAIGFFVLGTQGAILGIGLHMLPSTLYMLYYNRRFGLLDLRLEILMIPVWFAGWVVGHGANAVAMTVGHLIHG